MDLNDKVLKLWCEYNSKGIWVTGNGERLYIEELSDDHLMRIPDFLKRKYDLFFINEIPFYILQEIKERNMILHEDFHVEKKVIKNIKHTKKINRNTILLNRVRR